MSNSDIFDFADYDLEEDFPNLRAAGWRETSERDNKYNCIAYAAYDFRRKWDTARGYYWPPGALREYSVDAWADAFRVQGYRVCDTAELEDGYEKIAIYKKSDRPTHVARQLASGEWTSKLGPDEDINHNTLEALEGDFYGIIDRIMRRRRWVSPEEDNEQAESRNESRVQELQGTDEESYSGSEERTK